MSNGSAQLETGELVERLSTLEAEAAARLLGELIADQESRNDRNLVKPYQEKVPVILGALPEDRAATLLERLEPSWVFKALFKNFLAVPAGLQARLLERLRPPHAARIFERLSFGLDGPRIVVGLLERMRQHAQHAILAEMDPVLRQALIASTAWASCWVQRVSVRPAGQRTGGAALDRGGAGEGFSPNELARLARGWDEDALFAAMECLHPHEQAFVLRELDVDQTLAVLRRLAVTNPRRTAEVLEELDIRLLFPRRSRDGAIGDFIAYSSRLATLLERLDPEDPQLAAPLRRVSERHLRLALGRMRWEEHPGLAKRWRHAPAYLPLGLPRSTGTGRRRTRPLPGGLRWTRIEEVLRVGGWTKNVTKNVQIDVVAMESSRVRAKACASVRREALTPVTTVHAMLGSPKRDDGVSRAQFFETLGGVQLRRAVRESGAIAGINGNFYFDYGNYLDANDLGLRIAEVPGLLFGDLVGWLVCDGVELSPPIFNRSALVATADGRLHIRKVFIREVVLGHRWKVRWDRLNAMRRNGRVVLYNSLFGLQTGPDPSYTDLVIVGGHILQIIPGSDARIPLTGFVLSLHNEQAGNILRGIAVGDPVEVHNDFPLHLGPVGQAMACGPQLVRDGQPDLHFAFEDFGEKDSTTLPLSLTRAAETFEAARSFIMLQGEQVLLGTVSGISLGSGHGNQSRGVTFGELAQFAVDWGADQALALDGGGSSSIVVRWENDVRTLNVPTGGSDVPQGEERFINTYWLFFSP